MEQHRCHQTETVWLPPPRQRRTPQDPLRSHHSRFPSDAWHSLLEAAPWLYRWWSVGQQNV